MNRQQYMRSLIEQGLSPSQIADKMREFDCSSVPLSANSMQRTKSPRSKAVLIHPCHLSVSFGTNLYLNSGCIITTNFLKFSEFSPRKLGLGSFKNVFYLHHYEMSYEPFQRIWHIFVIKWPH